MESLSPPRSAELALWDGDLAAAVGLLCGGPAARINSTAGVTVPASNGQTRLWPWSSMARCVLLSVFSARAPALPRV